ncbi:MAG TPA: retroviral-like aspartic protease family protein [Sphingomicrobium sp.]|nr:retroviral-like aspartic protease family protein [Sphingomicrobium sp.]
MSLGLTQDAVASADPPKISKPRPAPATPPDIPPLPPAYFDPNLAVGGQEVKARKVETRLSVDVLVNGRGPYHFIVDSGADTSVVGLRIAHDLELPLASPVVLNAMTARNIVDRVKVDQLTVGSNTISNLELPALREVDVGGDGMIGIDALVQQRLMMDFEKHLIKVEDARIPERHEPGEIVITARRQRGQLILTHVKAAGYDLDAIIDTGSEITIGNLALRDKLIRHNRDKFVTVPVIGVTGASQDLQFARIAELRLGPVTLRDVPMAFADVPPFKMFGLSDEPALLLGTDLLDTFRRISLDFRARKVRFQLRRCEAAVVISTDPDNFSRISSNAGQEVCMR